MIASRSAGENRKEKAGNREKALYDGGWTVALPIGGTTGTQHSARGALLTPPIQGTVCSLAL